MSGFAKVQSSCPDCGAFVKWNTRAPGSLHCSNCNKDFGDAKMRETLLSSEILTKCAACGSDEMYRRKSFPKPVGIGIVIVAGAATVALAQSRAVPPWAIYAPLFAAALVDAILYKTTPDAAGCYRCLSVFFGVAPDESLNAYDLERAEEIRLGRKVGSQPSNSRKGGSSSRTPPHS
ncbi:MAG: hypothetical protein HY286_19620 [Planctomycetes bacterium]|nr:hypothetical protein [Planctomycetota bacterium]